MNLIRVFLFISIGALLLLTLQPDDSITAAYVRVSDQYRSTYAFDEADQYLQPALLRQSWNANLYVRSSSIALGLRELDRSAAQLDRADAGGAERWTVYRRRAELAEAQQKFELAASYWLSVTLIHPEDSIATLRLIKADIRLANFDAAQAIALGWLTRSGLPEAHFAYAKLIAFDDPIKAKSQFEQSPDKLAQEFVLALNDPKSSDPAYRAVALGRAYLATNDLPLASRAFQVAIAANSSYAEAYAYAGFTLDELGQDGSAQINRALEINQELVIARYFRALHEIAQGDQAKALIDLQFGIDREPKNYLVLIALGRVYSQQTDLKTAEKWLVAARDLQPNDGLSWQALCELYVGRGYGPIDQAVAAAQQLVNLAPNDSEAHVWLGRAYLRSGSLEFAERELRQAVALDPGSAAAHYFLGRFLKHDTAAGRLEFERALALDPAGPIGELSKKELSSP